MQHTAAEKEAKSIGIAIIMYRFNLALSAQKWYTDSARLSRFKGGLTNANIQS